MSGPSNPLNPTFEGHIASTLDALVLFEACLSGRLNHVPRRPHDRERQDLIKSGNIFIYEEHASGIKRWTDGISWSPSRILGNFLIYRELEKPFPPGEKKRALKKKKGPAGGTGKTQTSSRSSISAFSLACTDASTSKDAERALIGSLIDSYPFKDNGLIKKTISITHQGVPHHMVSYYNVGDVVSGRLIPPTRHPGTQGIIPRTELIMSQNFRAPIDEVEFGLDERGGSTALLDALPNIQDFGGGAPAILQQRAMTLPSFQPLPMSPVYGTPTYGYNPNQHYTPAMPSSMPPTMSQPLSSPMPPPPPMHHSTSSSRPSVSAPLPSNSSHMSYATQQQGNYSLDAQKAARFSSDSSLVHAFPRNMPTQNPSRRSSIFDVSQSSDMSPLSLGPIPDGRQSSGGNAFIRQASYFLPPQSDAMSTSENPVFSHHRPVKAEADLPPMDGGGPQNYGLDDNNSTWAFEGMDGSHAHHYFNQPDEHTAGWHGGPNGVGHS
ncbi:hypothetical protein E4U51_008098 [Claviceps purpurea]|nr:hypothetical protein E4U51_008098 [Claviceps purpurea]